MLPFFVTGANAFIRIAGKKIAACTDVSYSIRVKHTSPHVLGVFESFAQEPQGYEVTGSFTIIRYAKNMETTVKAAKGKQPATTESTGNGVGSWGGIMGKGGNKNAAKAVAGSMALGRPDQALDPAFFHVPGGFTLEIVQQGPHGSSGVLARLRDCRITQADFKLTKGGLAIQQFSFQANYADEDSFTAGVSGLGQQFM